MSTYEVLLHFMGSKPASPIGMVDTTNGQGNSTSNVGLACATDSGTFVTDPSRMVDWRCHFGFLPSLEDMKRAIKRHKCLNAGDDGHMSLLVKSVEWPTGLERRHPKGESLQPGEGIRLLPMHEIRPFLPQAYVEITNLQVIQMRSEIVDLVVKTEKQKHEKAKEVHPKACSCEACSGERGEVPPEVPSEDRGPTY